MTVGTFEAARIKKRPAASLFGDGFALMRERWAVYAAFAIVCAGAGVFQITLDDIRADPGGAFFRLPALRVAFVLSVIALYFIWPSALRRIDASFRMTYARAMIATLTIVCVGAVTELGYVAAVVPGVVVGVLLSQALIGTLLRAGTSTSPASLARALRDGALGSCALTREHFATTFGVVAFSLLILLVPCAVAIVALIFAYVQDPRSLMLTAPLLFLTFIYFECVRYGLIVRWYRRLDADRVHGDANATPLVERPTA